MLDGDNNFKIVFQQIWRNVEEAKHKWNDEHKSTGYNKHEFTGNDKHKFTGNNKYEFTKLPEVLHSIKHLPEHLHFLDRGRAPQDLP